MYIDACKICQIASINVFLGQSMSMICVYGLIQGIVWFWFPLLCMIFSLCCHSLCKSSLFLLIISSGFSLNSKKIRNDLNILSLNGC